MVRLPPAMLVVGDRHDGFPHGTWAVYQKIFLAVHRKCKTNPDKNIIWQRTFACQAESPQTADRQTCKRAMWLVVENNNNGFSHVYVTWQQLVWVQWFLYLECFCVYRTYSFVHWSQYVYMELAKELDVTISRNFLNNNALVQSPLFHVIHVHCIRIMTTGPWEANEISSITVAGKFTRWTVLDRLSAHKLFL